MPEWHSHSHMALENVIFDLARSGHVYTTIRIKNNVQKMDKKKMVEKKLCLLSTLATMLLRQIRFSPAQPVSQSGNHRFGGRRRVAHGASSLPDKPAKAIGPRKRSQGGDGPFNVTRYVGHLRGPRWVFYEGLLFSGTSSAWRFDKRLTGGWAELAWL